VLAILHDSTEESKPKPESLVKPSVAPCRMDQPRRKMTEEMISISS